MMSDMANNDIGDGSENAPPGQQNGGLYVRIIDHSGGGEDEGLEGGAMEELRGFVDLAHANAFARAYVRDSIERCRVPGASSRDVLESWFAFGENAEIGGAGEEGWKSGTELDDFIASPATPMERDWRALDPRRLVEEEVLPALEDDEADEDIGDDHDDDDDMITMIRH